MGIRYRLPGAREVGLLCFTINDVELADTVGFQLGLSVQPLRGRCTERGAGNDGQHDLGLCIHDASPPCRLKQTVRPLAGSVRSCDVRMLVIRDRKKRSVLESALADGTMAARSPERKTRHIPFPGQLSIIYTNHVL